MLQITSNENGFVVKGLDNGTYPQDGTLTLPANSTIVVTDESGMATFRSTANNDVIFSGLIDDITIDGQKVTKDTIGEKFASIANKSTGGGGEGGGGMTPEEKQELKNLRHDMENALGDIAALDIDKQDDIKKLAKTRRIVGNWNSEGNINETITLYNSYTKDDILIGDYVNGGVCIGFYYNDPLFQSNNYGIYRMTSNTNLVKLDKGTFSELQKSNLLDISNKFIDYFDEGKYYNLYLKPFVTRYVETNSIFVPNDRISLKINTRISSNPSFIFTTWNNGDDLLEPTYIYFDKDNGKVAYYRYFDDVEGSEKYVFLEIENKSLRFSKFYNSLIETGNPECIQLANAIENVYFVNYRTKDTNYNFMPESGYVLNNTIKLSNTSTQLNAENPYPFLVTNLDNVANLVDRIQFFNRYEVELLNEIGITEDEVAYGTQYTMFKSGINLDGFLYHFDGQYLKLGVYNIEGVDVYMPQYPKLVKFTDDDDLNSVKQELENKIPSTDNFATKEDLDKKQNKGDYAYNSQVVKADGGTYFAVRESQDSRFFKIYDRDHSKYVQYLSDIPSGATIYDMGTGYNENRIESEAWSAENESIGRFIVYNYTSIILSYQNFDVLQLKHVRSDIWADSNNIPLLGTTDALIKVWNSETFEAMSSNPVLTKSGYVYDEVRSVGKAVMLEQEYAKSLVTKDKLDAKQDKLTAGENITIEGNVISATGGGGDEHYKSEVIEGHSDAPVITVINGTTRMETPTIVWNDIDVYGFGTYNRGNSVENAPKFYFKNTATNTAIQFPSLNYTGEQLARYDTSTKSFVFDLQSSDTWIQETDGVTIYKNGSEVIFENGRFIKNQTIKFYDEATGEGDYIQFVGSNEVYGFGQWQFYYTKTTNSIDTTPFEVFDPSNINDAIVVDYMGKKYHLIPKEQLKTINGNSIIGEGNVELEANIEAIPEDFKTEYNKVYGISGGSSAKDTLEYFLLKYDLKYFEENKSVNQSVNNVLVLGTWYGDEKLPDYDNVWLYPAGKDRVAILNENNVKTINGQSIHGSGNIEIQGGGGEAVDAYTKTESDEKYATKQEVNQNYVQKTGEYVKNVTTEGGAINFDKGNGTPDVVNFKTVGGQSIIGMDDIPVPTPQTNDNGTEKNYIYSSGLNDKYNVLAYIGYNSTAVTPSTMILEFKRWGYDGKYQVNLPSATHEKAGVMSAADKTKLDSLPSVWKGTQSDYDALGIYDDSTLYLILED